MIRILVLLFILPMFGCITMPEPPTRQVVDSQRKLLNNFRVTFDEKDLEYKKVMPYEAPKYPKLAGGLDGCGKESTPLSQLNLVQIIKAPVHVSGKVKQLAISDSKHTYYRTKTKGETVDLKTELEEVFWKIPNQDEEVNYALFTMNDITACQNGVQLKRTYADLIEVLIQEVKEQVSLRNNEREKHQILYAGMKKEKTLEILKREIALEILTVDLKYAEDVTTYLTKKMDNQSLLLKMGSVLGIITLGGGALIAGVN